MQRQKIAALILAAGYSSRMGDFKPLLPLAGSHALGEAVARLRDAGIDDITVVTGHRADELAPVLDELGVKQVRNDLYDKGMLSSVLAGVASLGPDVDAFFLVPVDTPLFKASTLEALLRARERSGAPVVYPRYEGERGHPPLISAKVALDPPPLDHPGGFRAFLGRYEEAALDVDVTDRGTVMDFDTPADYERIRVYASREEIPSREECRSLWKRFGVPENIVAHCETVAELARILAVHLNLAGLELDICLIVAAGLLHDLVRGDSDHAAVGARILEQMGYRRVARIVACHMDKDSGGSLSVDEADLVYLADKCVEEDRPVSLHERFGPALERFASRPVILEEVQRRLHEAIAIQKRVEDILGGSLEELLRRHDRGLRAASMQGPRDIYLLRHGAIRQQGRGRRFIGQVDLPLSPEGIRQAEALGRELCTVRFSAVYCSDLARSVDTAKIVAESHCLQPVAREDLREIALGDWENLTFDEVACRFPAEFEERGRDIMNFQPPGGESFMDCARRAVAAFYAILQAHRGNVLIVGHAGVNRILLCQAMGISCDRVFEIKQDYGCLNVIGVKDYNFEVKVLNRRQSQNGLLN